MLASFLFSIFFNVKLEREPKPSVKEIAPIVFFFLLSFFINPPHPKVSSSVWATTTKTLYLIVS